MGGTETAATPISAQHSERVSAATATPTVDTIRLHVTISRSQFTAVHPKHV